MPKLPIKTLVSALSITMMLFTLSPQAIATPNKVPSSPTQNVKKTNKAFNTPSIKQIPSSSQTHEKPSFAPIIRPAKPLSNATARKHASDQLIVKFKQGSSVQEINKAQTALRLNVERTLDLSGAQLVRITGKSAEAALETLQASESVEYVQLNYLQQPDSVTDPLYPNLWGLENTGQSIPGSSTGTSGIDIGAESAWNTTQGDPNVIVAVIDTGTDYNHPDLKDNIWVNNDEIPGNGIDDDGNGFIDDINGWDFYNQDNTVYDALEGDEHGTHVSGTIAGAANNLGVVGVAPNVKIMPIKFLGPDGGYTSDAILSLDYAKKMGARIVNASWGGGGYEPALNDAITNSGLLFVAAAGNSAKDTDQTPHYPSSYAAPNIISVASITNRGALSNFSNYGKTSVDIAAPGSGILSSVPKIIDRGAGLEVSGTGNTGIPYNAIVQGFGLQEFASASTRTELLTKGLNKLGVNSTDPILLVQDDESNVGYPNHLGAYASALTGYSNVTLKTVAQDAHGPNADTLKQYKAVIWFTGSTWGTSSNRPLTQTDLQSLEAYLHSGGNLYLSGPDILYGVNNSNLVATMLKTIVLKDGGSGKSLKGLAGTAYDGISTNLDGVFESEHDELASAGPSGVINLNWPGDADYSQAYAYYNGTSMATPHVAGTAALILSAHPDFTNDMIKSSILTTATPLSSLTNKVVSGGMLNAAAAVAYEPDNDIPGVEVPGSGIINNTLDQSADRNDVFVVHLEKGQKLHAKMSSSTPGTDFDLYLYDKSATTVNSSIGILIASEKTGTSDENIMFTAPDTGNYYLNAYGYAGSGSYTLQVVQGAGSGTFENTSPFFKYTGQWNTVKISLASGYSYATVNTIGSAVEIIFTGTSIKYNATKNASQGLAKVTIDGANPTMVDLYASTPQYKMTVFEKTNLTPGVHKLRIEWTGQSGPLARKTSTSINIDSVIISNTQP